MHTSTTKRLLPSLFLFSQNQLNTFYILTRQLWIIVVTLTILYYEELQNFFDGNIHTVTKPKASQSYS